MLRNMAGIYITNGTKMLLLYRIGSRVVQPSWCNVGGHFEEFELNNPRACVLREVYEEIGIKETDLCNLKLRYVTLRYKNNEIRQNYYFFADLNTESFQMKDCNEGILEWVDIDKMLEREMPFTAKEVLKHFLSKGKDNDIIYAGVSSDGKVTFTELREF